MAEMQMLIEAVGMLAIAAGVFVFANASKWSVQTLKQETGSVFSLSVIAGAFVFYNLLVKIGNGDAAFHNYVIGLIALAVIVLDTRIVWEKYGRKAALARAFSSVYGALALVVITVFFFSGGGKKHDDKQ